MTSTPSNPPASSTVRIVAARREDDVAALGLDPGSFPRSPGLRSASASTSSASASRGMTWPWTPNDGTRAPGRPPPGFAPSRRSRRGAAARAHPSSASIFAATCLRSALLGPRRSARSSAPRRASRTLLARQPADARRAASNRRRGRARSRRRASSSSPRRGSRSAPPPRAESTRTRQRRAREEVVAVGRVADRAGGDGVDLVDPRRPAEMREHVPSPARARSARRPARR